MRWFLADLRTGRQIVDLPILSGRWQRYLNKPETITCTLDLQDPDTIQMRPRNAAAPGRSILACAEGDVVVAAGVVWAHGYDRDQKTVTLDATGMWSYFDHRYLLPLAAATLPVDQWTIPDTSSPGGTVPNPVVGTYLQGLEYGTIAKRWVQQARTWTGGSVPVVFEADRAGTRVRNMEGVDFKNVGTILTQLSQIEGGPDIRFFPRYTPDRLGVEFVFQTGTDSSPLLAGGPHRWDLTAVESAISQFRVDVDGTNLASIGWASGGRSVDLALVARSVDPTLTDLGYPLLETLDSTHSTVSVQATLDGYANEASLLGRRPGESWDFTVENTNPGVGEVWEGDWCTVTAAAYDPTTGQGDPYLYEKVTSERRITYMSGDQDGLTLDLQTMEKV